MRQGMKMLVLLVAMGAFALVPAMASAADHEIGITDLNTFDPSSLQVDEGDSVTWRLSPFVDGTPLSGGHDVWVCGVDPLDPDAFCGEGNPLLVQHEPVCEGYEGVPYGECADREDPTMTLTFNDSGKYTFICQIHAGVMFGDLQVGEDAPPVQPKPAKFKLAIKPKKGTVKAGKTQTVKVTVKNNGGSDATGVKVCPKGPKKLVKGLKCKSLGKIVAGKSKVAKLKIKTKKKVKGTAKLKFKTTGKGVKTVTGKFKLKVKKKK